MNDKSTKYKESLRVQVTYTSVWFGVVGLLGYYLYPVNTPDKAIIFVPIAAALAVIAIWLVNRATKVVVCPFCKEYLYDFIQRAELNNKENEHCPNCGNEIQI